MKQYTLLALELLLIALGLNIPSMAQSNAPTNLAGTTPAYNRVVLTWKDNSTNETKFEIERNNFTSFTKIGEVSANVTTYTDNTVSGSGSYTYRVRAVFVTGASGYSNETTVSTPQEPPGAPAGLSAAAQGSSSIKLTWNNGSGGTPTDYQVERGSSSGGPFTLLQTVSYSRTPTFTDNGVTGGNQYCYRVRARNGGGSSDYSGVSCATTSLAATNVANLKATALSSSSIKLTWDRYGKETGIYIERRIGQSGSWSRIASTLADGGEYTDNGLSGGTEYCYRIGEDGHNYSSTVCATTQQSAPSAPARLTANAVSSSQIDLQWADLSNNETGFQVERASSPTASFTKIADLGANTTSYSDQGLSASTQYCYRVRAVNGAGASGYTDTQCATTQAPPVGTPQNLVVTASSTTQINLTWAGVSGASSYQLERSPNGNDNWTKIADPAGNATSYNDQNLTPNTRYYYRIRAVIGGNTGPYSNVANAITPDSPPAAPARLTATAASATQINLAWADLSGNEAGFEIERSADGNTGWTKIGDAPANATSFQNTGLTPNTRYFYRVRAVNAAGQSAYSNTADATTPDVPPTAPANLAATPASATQINLTWADQSANETGFEVERGNSQTGAFTKVADLPANTTTYQDQGLTPAATYCYRVRAKNTIGASAYSNVACSATPDVPPVAPANLKATVISTSQINLSWSDQSTNESGFEIERSSSATGTFAKVADLPANVTTYEDKNLTDNTQYCYRVRAKNAAGNSGYTDVACATTPLAPPGTPANLTAQVVDYDQIKLNWASLSSTAVTVRIERSTSPNGPFQEIKTVPAAQTTYTDPGLQEFTTYYYQIRAVNAAGNSGYSNVASAQIKEILIAVEDEWITQTQVFVADRTLHLRTDWHRSNQAQIQLHSLTGRVQLTDNRRVTSTDAWSYSLAHLPTGLYVIAIAAEGRLFTKQIVVP